MSVYDTVIPGLPSPLDEPTVISPTNVFTLHYRAGSNILFLQFHLPKPSPELSARDHFRLAVERAKLHCEKMRYRFNYCVPYITDLDEAEKRMPL